MLSDKHLPELNNHAMKTYGGGVDVKLYAFLISELGASG
jgi:hypothetical protein